MVSFSPARPADAAALSDLALRSKGHWGYDAAFLEACREELTIDPSRCDGVRVVAAWEGDSIVGFHRVGGAAPVGDLLDLFVEPSAIGHGIGGLLMGQALAVAAELGMTALTIDSDPFAEPFYLAAGAVRVGEVASGSIPGRRLPRLRIDVRVCLARPGSTLQQAPSGPAGRCRLQLTIGSPWGCCRPSRAPLAPVVPGLV